MTTSRRNRPLIVGLLVALAANGATSANAADGGDVLRRGEFLGFTYVVGWKVLDAGVDLPNDAQLLLFWFPTSPDEALRSSLARSPGLSRLAERCVAPLVVPPNEKTRHEKYQAPDGQASLILAEPNGSEVLRFPAHTGLFDAREVETLLKAEIARRESAARTALSAAAKAAAGGDQAGAIEAYEKVWAARCLFPGLAKKAATALEALGVPVQGALILREPQTTSSALAAVAGFALEGIAAFPRRHDGDAERHRRIEPPQSE
ncbi:MAG: hypothetical protein ABI609_01355 [Acidobacteriota bacterium]